MATIAIKPLTRHRRVPREDQILKTYRARAMSDGLISGVLALKHDQ
jgi:hypothetical protein